MSQILEQLDWLPHPIKLTTDSTDGQLLKAAYCHGNETSPDPSTKNGAVLVGPDGVILEYASNRFAPGVAETINRLNDRPTKYKLVVHAEHGAILNAARHGYRTEGAVLYCPFYSCCECAKAIIQAGIKRVVGHAQLMILALDHSIWRDSIQDGWNMLQEAGVECSLFNGTLNITARFNYQDVAV